MRLAKKHRNAGNGWSEWSRLGGGPGDGFDGPDVVRTGRGAPLVLLPGLAGGTRLLAPLITSLASHFEVFALGLRGDRGVCLGRDGQGAADHAREVADRLQTLGLERPTVLGVSFGGAVALELAVRRLTRWAR